MAPPAVREDHGCLKHLPESRIHRSNHPLSVLRLSSVCLAGWLALSLFLLSYFVPGTILHAVSAQGELHIHSSCGPHFHSSSHVMPLLYDRTSINHLWTESCAGRAMCLQKCGPVLSTTPGTLGRWWLVGG